MTSNELFEARTNPDFLKYLEENRVNSIKEKNISLMYETLDSMLVLNLDEDKINSLYDEILNLSFLKVEEILSKDELLTLKEEQLLYARALYEHAIEKWTNDNLDGAKELFFVMANIIDDEVLKKAIQCLLIFLAKNISFDDFYDNSVNHNASNDEKYGYFIVDFSFNVEDLLKENLELLKNLYENLEHLIEKRN